MSTSSSPDSLMQESPAPSSIIPPPTLDHSLQPLLTTTPATTTADDDKSHGKDPSPPTLLNNIKPLLDQILGTSINTSDGKSPLKESTLLSIIGLKEEEEKVKHEKLKNENLNKTIELIKLAKDYGIRPELIPLLFTSRSSSSDNIDDMIKSQMDTLTTKASSASSLLKNAASPSPSPPPPPPPPPDSPEHLELVVPIEESSSSSSSLQQQQQHKLQLQHQHQQSLTSKFKVTMPQTTPQHRQKYQFQHWPGPETPSSSISLQDPDDIQMMKSPISTKRRSTPDEASIPIFKTLASPLPKLRKTHHLKTQSETRTSSLKNKPNFVNYPERRSQQQQQQQQQLSPYIYTPVEMSHSSSDYYSRSPQHQQQQPRPMHGPIPQLQLVSIPQPMHYKRGQMIYVPAQQYYQQLQSQQQQQPQHQRMASMPNPGYQYQMPIPSQHQSQLQFPLAGSNQYPPQQQQRQQQQQQQQQQAQRNSERETRPTSGKSRSRPDVSFMISTPSNPPK